MSRNKSCLLTGRTEPRNTRDLILLGRPWLLPTNSRDSLRTSAEERHNDQAAS